MPEHNKTVSPKFQYTFVFLSHLILILFFKECSINSALCFRGGSSCNKKIGDFVPCLCFLRHACKLFIRICRLIYIIPYTILCASCLNWAAYLVVWMLVSFISKLRNLTDKYLACCGQCSHIIKARFRQSFKLFKKKDFLEENRSKCWVFSQWVYWYCVSS